MVESPFEAIDPINPTSILFSSIFKSYSVELTTSKMILWSLITEKHTLLVNGVLNF